MKNHSLQGNGERTVKRFGLAVSAAVALMAIAAHAEAQALAQLRGPAAPAAEFDTHSGTSGIILKFSRFGYIRPGAATEPATDAGDGINRDRRAGGIRLQHGKAARS